MGPNQTDKLLYSKGNHKTHTHTHTKRQPTEWEKTVANDAPYRGLMAKHTSNSYNSTTKK